jgi:hypothetical protein
MAFSLWQILRFWYFTGQYTRQLYGGGSLRVKQFFVYNFALAGNSAVDVCEAADPPPVVVFEDFSVVAGKTLAADLARIKL